MNYQLISMINLSLDMFFAAIRNGAMHSIDELSTQLSIPTSKLKELSAKLTDAKSTRIQREAVYLGVKKDEAAFYSFFLAIPAKR